MSEHGESEHSERKNKRLDLGGQIERVHALCGELLHSRNDPDVAYLNIGERLSFTYVPGKEFEHPGTVDNPTIYGRWQI